MTVRERLNVEEALVKGRENPQYTKIGSAVICIVFAAFLLFFGVWSFTDTDKTVSESENRNLAAAPAFSLTAVFDRSFTGEFDTYYADTFPMRESFLALNRKISNLLTGTKGADDIVLVQKQDKDDFAGQDIDYNE